MNMIYIIIPAHVVVVAGIIAWCVREKAREATKRWQKTQESEQKAREADMEAIRLGYVQEWYLSKETPGDTFKHGFNAMHKTYSLRWVKPDLVDSHTQNEAFKDLFDRMCKDFGIEIGKDTWAEAEAKIKARKAVIAGMGRDIRQMRQDLEQFHKEMTSDGTQTKPSGPLQPAEMAEANPAAEGGQ